MYVKGVILNEDLMMMMTNCEIDTTWMKVQGKKTLECVPLWTHLGSAEFTIRKKIYILKRLTEK